MVIATMHVIFHPFKQLTRCLLRLASRSRFPLTIRQTRSKRDLMAKTSHVCILTLAWAYVLAARWAEAVSRATAPRYTESSAAWKELDTTAGTDDGDGEITVDLGRVSNDATRWRAAVPAPNEGWGPWEKGNRLSDASNEKHQPIAPPLRIEKSDDIIAARPIRPAYQQHATAVPKSN